MTDLAKYAVVDKTVATDVWGSVDLALDDEALYHRLSTLRTFEDCAELITMLHVSELVHYGDYPSSAVKEW